jgi:DNA topoisomerase VI subunit B
LYMAVRELIENSLDSCEANHILPDINLTLKNIDSINDLWLISCEDNGIGIPPDKVPVAVCSFLTSGKYVEKQQRGLFGVGTAKRSFRCRPQDDSCIFHERH